MSRPPKSSGWVWRYWARASWSQRVMAGWWAGAMMRSLLTPLGRTWGVKPWGEAATVCRGGGGGAGGGVAGGGGADVVVAVDVGAAEAVDDVEAEVVAGAGVAAGELLGHFGGVLGVQGHGAWAWKISWTLMRWMPWR